MGAKVTKYMPMEHVHTHSRVAAQCLHLVIHGSACILCKVHDYVFNQVHVLSFLSFITLPYKAEAGQSKGHTPGYIACHHALIFFASPSGLSITKAIVLQV